MVRWPPCWPSLWPPLRPPLWPSLWPPLRPTFWPPLCPYESFVIGQPLLYGAGVEAAYVRRQSIQQETCCDGIGKRESCAGDGRGQRDRSRMRTQAAGERI
ncbi:hypothetical protein BN2475_30034 [Paraburkholderia ribeironis]|uniref:Uncharacterized protein n=1 Tax=Paraburkholderia ribeironis TaxID=1247936 RepID=A0A1N7RIQ0_9BURK|nr:hypothetical protein BN2475_30034 [Paraburkholderia ribeironis]